jgi:hypothetical protein
MKISIPLCSLFRWGCIFCFVHVVGVLPLSAKLWISFESEGGVGYFLRQSPAQIMRYDLNAETWLEAVPLDDVPTAFVLSGDKVFIAFGTRIERFDWETRRTEVWAKMRDRVTELIRDGDRILVGCRDSYSGDGGVAFVSATVPTEGAVEYVLEADGINDLVYSASTDRLFLLSSEIFSPFQSYQFDSNGALVTKVEPEVDFDKGWMSPDGEELVVEDGIVFSSRDWSFDRFLSDSIKNVVWGEGGELVLLTNTSIRRFSEGAEELGRVDLPYLSYDVGERRDMALTEEAVYLFSEFSASPREVVVDRILLKDFGLSELSVPPLPVGLEFVPTDSMIDGDGVVYLLSRENRAVFRWNAATQQYMPSIGLPVEGASSRSMAHHHALNRVYVDVSGEILAFDAATLERLGSVVKTKVREDAWTPMESDLLFVSALYSGETFVRDEEGKFIETGFVLSAGDFSYLGPRNIFYLEERDELYYGAAIYPYEGNGKFGPADYDTLGGRFTLAVSPDGSEIITQSGQRYQLDTGTEQMVKNTRWITGVWNSVGELFTVPEEPTGSAAKLFAESTIQKWSEDGSLVGVTTIPGEFVFLGVHEASDHLVIVTMIDGRPSFSVLDRAFNEVPPPLPMRPRLVLEQSEGVFARLRWIGDAFSQYSVERRILPDGVWSEIAFLPAGQTEYLDSSLDADAVYQYRLRAKLGEKVSIPSVGVNFDRRSGVLLPDPRDAEFPTGRIIATPDGRLFFLSTEDACLFQWNSSDQDWGESIPLEGAALDIAYSESSNSLFTRYEDGRINRISLSGTSLREKAFLRRPALLGFLPVDSSLVLGEYSSSQPQRFLVVGVAGDVVEGTRTSVWPGRVEDGEWSPLYRSVFWFESSISPDRVYVLPVANNGELGEVRRVDFPWAEIVFLIPPLRLDPTGARAVLGSGRILDLNTFSFAEGVSEENVDAVWLEDRLVTVRSGSIESWSLTDYSLLNQRSLNAGPVRLFAVSKGELVLVSKSDSGGICVDVFDRDLTRVFPLVLSETPKPSVRVSEEQGGEVVWGDVTGEDGYVLERKTGSGPWTELARTGWNQTSWLDSTINFDAAVVSYRVKALRGEEVANPSPALEVVPSIPTATFLSAWPESSSSIRLSWDSVPLAVSYRLERKRETDPWVAIATLGSLETQHLDEGLASWNRYSYRLIPIGTVAEGLPGNTVSLSPFPTTPSSVSGVTVSDRNAGMVAVQWEESYGTSYYRIERAELDERGQASGWNVVATMREDESIFIDTSVMPNTRYRYRIFAGNASGESVATHSEDVRSAAMTRTLLGDLRLRQVSGTSAEISWNRYWDIEEFQIYRRGEDDAQWSLWQKLEGQQTRVWDESLSLGETAYYRVEANNLAGEAVTPAFLRITMRREFTLFEENFEGGFDSARFVRCDPELVLNGPEGIESHLRFDLSDQLLELPPLDLSEGGTISFSLLSWWNYLYIRNDASLVFWDDTEQDWELVSGFEIRHAGYGEWATYHLEIPEGQWEDEVRLAWMNDDQPFGNSLSWGVDNIRISTVLPEVPSVPELIQVVAQGDGSVLIVWSMVAEAVIYRIERSESDSGIWTVLGETSGPTDQWFDAGVEVSRNYRYRVKAGNRGGWSLGAVSEVIVIDAESPEWRDIGKQMVLSDPHEYGLLTAGDLELQYASGRQSVLDNPEAFDLIDSASLANARLAGREAVLRDPSLYGLAAKEPVNYYEIGDPALWWDGFAWRLQWYLFRSEDLQIWEPFALDFDVPSWIFQQGPVFLQTVPEVEDE